MLIAIPYDGDHYDTVLGALLQDRTMEISKILYLQCLSYTKEIVTMLALAVLAISYVYRKWLLQYHMMGINTIQFWSIFCNTV